MQGLRWERVQELFHGALELPASERDAYLAMRCTDDPSLIPEVSALLAEDSQRFAMLDEGVAGVAEALLEPRAALAGKSIGPYRIVRLLGEGGMGVVYLAERADLARHVAIKVLRDAGLSPARRALFTAEQRTLAQLIHPSITRLYDADVTPDGTPYIVMEFIEGESLTGYCERRACNLESRLKLFRAVCEAVQYAHQHAVIHRDLKPSNIVVRADGSVSLLDFGIAKHVEDLAGPASQTRTTLRLMTPLYAAPEQLTGGVVGVQTDVYALGVILYQLLTGRTPFEVAGLTPLQVERVVTKGAPMRPSVHGRAYLGDHGHAASWPELDVLSLKALHRDPAERYGSVEALIRDLEHYGRHEPLDARPESFAYRARMYFGRHRLSTSAVAAALLLALALGTFFTWRLENEHAAALKQAARAQRIQTFVTSLIQGGDADAGPAESLKVITLLDRGAQEAAGLKADPLIQADMYETLGTLYQNLGSLDRADSLLTAALQLRREHSQAGQPTMIVSLDALALLRLAQGKLPEAESLAREALRIAQADQSSPEHSRALVTMGRVQAERGHYEEAIGTLKEALAHNSTARASELDLIASLRALGAAEYSAGKYDASHADYERLLALDRKLHGANHPAVADDLESLSSIQQDLGYYAAAEAFARDGLAIVTTYYGADHPKTAGALTILGRSLLYEKKYDQAVDALQRALAIEQRDFGPVHASVADTLNELGNVASLRGDYVGAQQSFQRVADIYRSIYSDQHYLVAIALSNVAYAKLNLKDYAAAEAGFRDVVQRFTQALGKENINTGIAQIKLGRVLLRERHFAEAEEQTHAGYDNLSRQSNPGISFLQAARTDLTAEYGALGNTQLAQHYRTELAANRDAH
ncbi:MAG TPA: tetratricopeptide repeat protein [Steroidobacteraceae bacterium]|jgi:serine/threonine-protein kinase